MTDINEIRINRVVRTDVNACELCDKPVVWVVESYYSDIDPRGRDVGPVSFSCDEHLWTVVPDPRTQPEVTPATVKLWRHVTKDQLKKGMKNYLEGK